MRPTMMLALAAATCLAVVAAQAQPDTGRPSQTGLGLRNTPIRVESSLAVQIPLAPGANIEEQVKQTEAARKAVYGMAARECAALMDVFKSDCRLLSLRANSNVQNRGNAADQVFVNGSATYELSDRQN